MKIGANLAIFLLGMGLLTAGIWQIYPPAAFICDGLIFMAISLFGGRAA